MYGLEKVSLSLVTLKQIFKNMVKSSKVKYIVCGKYLEEYIYEKPFYWNLEFKTREKSLSTIKERTDSSIARARQNLYRLIMANIDEKQKYKNLFVTLTFKENITDIKQANYEFKKFMQRFNFFYRKKVKYITVIEFQERGAIHYHALFFNIPFIKDLHLKIEKIWGLGYTAIKPLTDINNVSAYVSKYIRKGFFDKRLFTQKCYFSSRDCIRPVEYRRIESLDIIKKRSKLQISTSSYLSNKHGEIKKNLYKFN